MIDYFSYKLSILSNRLSVGTSRLYADRYDLTLRNWRIINIVGHFQPISPIEISKISHYDRGQVSRALEQLEARLLIQRTEEGGVGNKTSISLSDAGMRMFNEILPIARQREAELLSAIPAEDVKSLNLMIDALLAKAQTMNEELEQRRS